ncbi:hypothetical protein [Serratia proteamaculans]|uniref:hypothetical protein n=1 Tax=Serratia proteamaculans TaxID=28151 RepID=UPI0029823FE2|nr:hypothetical protein [Serratia proteamaculans]MDW5510470.1 hypothetical protein [Serratia proteamaculans]
MRRILVLFFIFTTSAMSFSCIANVGFLSPSGVSKNFADKVNFAMINVYNEQQLKENLEIAKGNNLTLLLDLGPSLNTSRNSNDIKMNYHDSSNTKNEKLLPPLNKNKLRKLPSDSDLLLTINRYMPLIKQYNKNISAIFLADEPYLNGLDKEDLEKVAGLTRAILNDNGLSQIKLGVIFASAMFNKDFAANLDAKSGEYVKSIDSHYQEISNKVQKNTASTDEKEWLNIIKNNRLTTYDSAGNIYTKGGIPKGFDIYTFDFYLSTILLDQLYNDIPSWLAAQGLDKSCDVFKGKTIKDLRSELSFFKAGPMNTSESDIKNDKKILDQLYLCRMSTVTKLLQNEITSSAPNSEIVIISESSSNGVMEFDPEGNIKTAQPEKLIELRVLEEVQRAKEFYSESKTKNISGLMFFLYNNEYDKTIKINIGGAASMPSVLSEIYSTN